LNFTSANDGDKEITDLLDSN